jgi:hypothetical protein
MYKFLGAKVTRKRFWELSEIAKDVLLIEQANIQKKENTIENSLVKELLNDSRILNNEVNQINTTNNLEKENLACKDCGSRFVLKKSKWGSFLVCSNICNCSVIRVV